MQNETSNDTNTLEAEIRKAVEQGHDIQDMVRKLTLRKISTRSLDIESLRQIAGAVMRGARAGAQKELQHSSAQNKIARDQLQQAVSGLDVALAQLAEASRLALDEAASRTQRFSSEDMVRVRADLEKLESMFLETVQNSASSARDAAGEILHDLAEHSRIHGSAVGAQLRETLDAIAHQMGAAGRAQAKAGVNIAHATSDLLRQITAGVLAGMADHVKPGHSKAKSQ